MRSSNAVTYRGTLAIWSGGAGRRRSFLANAKCKRTVMHCTHSCHRHSFMANAKCKRSQCTAHAHALSAQPRTKKWVRERTAFHVTCSCCRRSLLAKTKWNKRTACTRCHMPCTGGVRGWVWARRHTDGALDDGYVRWLINLAAHCAAHQAVCERCSPRHRQDLVLHCMRTITFRHLNAIRAAPYI